MTMTKKRGIEGIFEAGMCGLLEFLMLSNKEKD